MHHGALVSSIGEDVPRYVAEGRFRQAPFDCGIQLQQGGYGPAQNTVPTQDLSDLAWLQH